MAVNGAGNPDQKAKIDAILNTFKSGQKAEVKQSSVSQAMCDGLAAACNGGPNLAGSVGVKLDGPENFMMGQPTAPAQDASCKKSGQEITVGKDKKAELSADCDKTAKDTMLC